MAYLAEASDGRHVALKMSLYPRGPEWSAARQQHERFLRQVAVLLQLRGVPGIAHVYAHDMYPDASESGYAYMVQEWVKDSIDVLDWFRAEPRPLKALVGGWMLLANACAEMHARGICHRDLKPENILVKPVGHGAPKIVDLDSAFSVGAEPLTTTGAGHWPGTRRYYSPEVVKAILNDWNSGESPQPYQYRPPSDIWALGVILYEVLTGKYPFEESDDPDELFESIVHDLPERPRALNPAVPFGLDKVTMRLLRKDPTKRPDGDELTAELESLFETKDDWERPFQTPARTRHASGTSRTESTPRPPTPRLSYWGGFRDSTAWQPAPTAIVLAGPRPLAVRGPCALVRLEPVPVALAAVPRIEENHQPAPRRRTWPGRRALLLASVLALAFAGSVRQGGTMLFGRAKVAVVAGASALLTACPLLTGRVRAGDKEWLNTKCSAEARKTAQDLDLDNHGPVAFVEGPNVIEHDYGTEVRNGPVVMAGVIPASPKGVSVVLFGEIRTGTDGASIQITRLQVYPDGPERPICGIIYVRGSRGSPGIPKREVGPFPPASELHPGYVLVDPLAALQVEIAL